MRGNESWGYIIVNFWREAGRGRLEVHVAERSY